MGTAGITHFHEGDLEKPSICFVYKQSDGYPESLGEQIKSVLGGKALVNGIRFDLEDQSNGSGCAAAQFIAAIKEGAGGVYMLSEAKDWADFDYHVYYNGQAAEPGDPPNHFRMKIMSGTDEIWDGVLSGFDSSELYDEDED